MYYDGACALCRASRRWLEGRDPDGTFVFVDSGSALAAVPAGVTRAELDRAVWVRLPGGDLVSGYDAVVAALAALPRAGAVARLAGLPVVRRIGARVYRLVAALRKGVPSRRRSGGPTHPRA